MHYFMLTFGVSLKHRSAKYPRRAESLAVAHYGRCLSCNGSVSKLINQLSISIMYLLSQLHATVSVVTASFAN